MPEYISRKRDQKSLFEESLRPTLWEVLNYRLELVDVKKHVCIQSKDKNIVFLAVSEINNIFKTITHTTCLSVLSRLINFYPACFPSVERQNPITSKESRQNDYLNGKFKLLFQRSMGLILHRHSQCRFPFRWCHRAGGWEQKRNERRRFGREVGDKMNPGDESGACVRPSEQYRADALGHWSTTVSRVRIYMALLIQWKMRSVR